MRSRSIFLAALCACVAMAAAVPQAAVSSYTWKEDFQGSDLGQFASYPPVQDVGYDPSLSPATGFGAPGGRALMRILKPSRTGEERFGFIRALDLVTAAKGSLTFSYRLDFARLGDTLEVGIAGSNAKRYAATVAVEGGEAWHAVHIPLARLLDPAGRAAPAHTGIEALFIVATLRKASADITYRFLIDDLRLEAARKMCFDVRTPRVVSIAHWPELFAAVNVESGRPIAVKAVAPLRLSKAECVVEDQDGRPVGGGELHDTAHEGVWSNDAVPAAGAGIYTLVLRGTAEDGRTISTCVRVLRRPATAAIHPRLFFGPEDRDRLAARTRDPKYAPIWQHLRERARLARGRRDWSHVPALFALLDPVYLLPTLPGYINIADSAGESVELNSLDAYLTDDAESRAAAKTALLAIARWNAWAPPWFPEHGQHTYYPAGQLTERVAFAYDLLYDRLTPDERGVVRGALREYGIARSYHEYVADNRILANTSNWIGHTVGGALVAAAAIWGDADDGDLPLQTNGLLRKFEDHLAASYLDDGSYGEGVSYQEFDLESTGLALTAIERVLGLNYWDRSYVKDSLAYPLATLAQPVRGSLDTGDSHSPSGYTSAPIVARLRDPVFAWYYDHFQHRSFHDFVFADLSLPAQPPSGPGSRYFARKGYVIFRTGWGEEDTLVLFRAGPNFNHNHADQGSFLLRVFGENLVREAGPAHYYQDPYYDSFFKQAAGHNTLLVDDDPESQEVADTQRFPALNRYPRMADVLLSLSLGAATAELEQVYRGRLRSYTRRILSAPPGYLVICDDLVADRTPTPFDWRVHLPDVAQVKTDGASAVYVGPKASLAVLALFPADAALRVESGHLPYSIFNPSAPQVAPPNPAILDIRTRAPASQTRFLVLLAHARSEADARAFVSSARRIDEAGWEGFETSGDHADLVLFRKEPAVGEAPYADWSTDAAAWLARRENGGDTLLAGQQVTALKRGGRVLFTSDRAVSFVAEQKGDHLDLTFNAPAAAKGEVARADGSLADWNVPAGQQHLTIR
ncbi:MAG TPA: heparinase II/III family protein [Bryobacteraceae bacterium]|nr:heparinase II/III family protein [Bryobacteraceae bacterium]